MFTIDVYEASEYLFKKHLAKLEVAPDGQSLDATLRRFASAFELGGLSDYQLMGRIKQITVQGVEVNPLCVLKTMTAKDGTAVVVVLLPEDARMLKWSKDDAWLMANLQDLEEVLNKKWRPRYTCVICGNQFDASYSSGYSPDSTCGAHAGWEHRLYGPHNVWTELRRYTPSSGPNVGQEFTEWVAVVKIGGKLYDMRNSYTSGSFIAPHRVGEIAGFERGCLGGLSHHTMERIWHERRGEWAEALDLRKRWE